jgi:preprotein translocase subunit YajC
MKNLGYKVIMLASSLMTSSLFGAVSEQEMQDSRQQNYMQSLIMIGAMVLFFYFILLRPEQKRRKKLEEQRNSLQKGSKVTAMGIVGVVDKIEEKTIILKMIDGSRIEVLKGAITDVEPAPTVQPQ